MLAWLVANLATLIISALLVAIVALVVVSMIKKKKKGNTSCSSGCGSCPMSGSCHENNQ